VTPLSLADIPSLEAFEAAREELRQAVIRHKARRRLAVGDQVTLLFEDRETLRWQVLEMCRVEGTAGAESIQHELDVYNELVPGPGELSATLFIEITDAARIRPALDRLLGLDAHVALSVGGSEARARFDQKQLEEERISAVHYLRFALDEAQVRAFLDPQVPVSVRIDHPHYEREVPLPPSTRESLCVDLQGDPPSLLDFRDRPAPAPPQDTLLFERGRVRALLPARPRAAGHRIVEATGDAPALPGVESSLLGELMAVAQELAAEVLQEFGSCRVSIDAAATPLRLDVYAPTER
jgi:hypothetical protein